MISIFIISHAEIANSFAYCLEHILNRRVENLVILSVKKTESIENIYTKAKEISRQQLMVNNGVLILSDIFGATPSNIASRLVKPGEVALITGLNLPMLIRAVAYSNSSLENCTSKAFNGGVDGIIQVQGV